MNRRAFLTASLVAAGGFWFLTRQPRHRQAAFRSVLFDHLDRVRALGAAFRQTHPQLTVVRQSRAGLHELLSQHASAIERDFETGQVLVINGWLVSRTEAQICAAV